MGTSLIIGIVLVLGILALFAFLALLPIGTYIKCLSAGVPTNPVSLIAMNLRKVPIDNLVDCYIKATKGGVDVTLDKLEAHFLSGGDVDKVVNAIISATKASILLPFPKAAAIDLAGRDVLEAVRMQVHPQVVATGNICGVAKNGIEIIAKAKVTIRANLDTMVGGAGEETILARIGEGIVSAIGSSKIHTEVLEKPEIITQKIMSAGLDSGTAFEIVSLDIFDLDVGRNIGAILQNDQAEADKKVAQAKAEGRRALAFAQMQENKATEQEAKAKLVEAEMKVPKALASSFKTGKLLANKTCKTPGRPPDHTPPKPGITPTTKLGFGADIG